MGNALFLGIPLLFSNPYYLTLNNKLCTKATNG